MCLVWMVRYYSYYWITYALFPLAWMVQVIFILLDYIFPPLPSGMNGVGLIHTITIAPPSLWHEWCRLFSYYWIISASPPPFRGMNGAGYFHTIELYLPPPPTIPWHEWCRLFSYYWIISAQLVINDVGYYCRSRSISSGHLICGIRRGRWRR